MVRYNTWGNDNFPLTVRYSAAILGEMLSSYTDSGFLSGSAPNIEFYAKGRT
jgi:hypothetical protein